MEFQVENNKIQNLENYSEDEIDVAYEFAKKVHDELGNFVKALILFGSSARKKKQRGGLQEKADKKDTTSDIEGNIRSGDKSPKDIDILLIVDDVALKLTRELVQTYRVIIEKVIREVSTDLHVITLKFTSFWEYVRAGDPVAINVLRDGVPVLDTGFFEPMQVLLNQGRIRPSPESVWSYFKKAPMSLKNSEWHVRQAVLDLYWAVIDSAHAALMKMGEIPPSPEHAAEMLEEKLVKPGALEPKYAKIMNNFYHLMKGITHGDIQEVSGEHYDDYYKKAEDFVEEMEKFLQQD